MTDLNTTPQPTKYKVLLIGDSCLDEYKFGVVDRLSPEAPVPVVKVVNQYMLPGMSANVRQNLTSLGVAPDFVTNHCEIKKTRYIDQRSGQHLLRVDSESNVDNWNGSTPQDIIGYDAIVISDYNKGFLTYTQIEQIIRDSTCPVFIDTKKQDLAKFSADRVFVKINESEYKNSQSLPTNLIVTLGDRGAMINQKGATFIYGSKSVEVMDVCGCGDTFLSALVFKYLFTKNINQAIIFANAAASVTVQHRGNYAPTLEEIDHAGY